MIAKIKKYLTKENFLVLAVSGMYSFFLFIPLDKIFSIQIDTYIKINQDIFLGFLGAYLFVYFVNFLAYSRSLNALFENETEETNKAIWFGNFLSVIFWITWTITTAMLYKSFCLRNIDVYLFSLSLVVIPSLITFFLSYDLRKEDIKQNIEISGENYLEKDDNYTLNTQWYHYSGYFALLSIPLYLILSLIPFFKS